MPKIQNHRLEPVKLTAAKELLLISNYCNYDNLVFAKDHIVLNIKIFTLSQKYGKWLLQQ